MNPTEEETPRPIVTVKTLMISVALLGLVGTLALPNLIAARKHRSETDAIGALKTICVSESIFREGDKENDGKLDYATLAELSATQLVDGLLGSGTKNGYVFAATPSLTTPDFLWFATASPTEPRETGDRYFATNHAGVIFYTTAAPVRVDARECALPLELHHGCR